MNIKELDQKYIAGTYGRYDIILHQGQGSLVTDENGKEYVDFASGIGVNSLGFCDSQWVEAVSEQAGTLQHCSNYFYTEPPARLAEKLCKGSGMKKVFFGNSGAEANEGAIKVARKYGNRNSSNPRHNIITLKNSFHGRTMAAITATGQEELHKDFSPFMGGFLYCEPEDFSQMEELTKNSVCAIMLEIIQGEGGLVVISLEFMEKVQKLCREKNILFIVDEVQTGIGRTGNLFAYQEYGLQPDIVTFAKGIGGGLPIGGFLLGDRTEAVLEPGDHGSTYGGNPVACAGANVVMDRLNKDFLHEVKKKGEYLKENLLEIPGVQEIQGMGLMIGFKVAGLESKKVAAEALKRGLILLTAKDRLRFLPPLNISYDELNQGLEILRETVKDM